MENTTVVVISNETIHTFTNARVGETIARIQVASGWSRTKNLFFMVYEMGWPDTSVSFLCSTTPLEAGYGNERGERDSFR